MNKTSKKKMTSQSHVVLLLIISILSVILFIGYTDTIKSYNFLPNLSTHLKSTLCTVWTNPCRQSTAQRNEILSGQKTDNIVKSLATDRLLQTHFINTDKGNSMKRQGFQNDKDPVMGKDFLSSNANDGIALGSNLSKMTERLSKAVGGRVFNKRRGVFEAKSNTLAATTFFDSRKKNSVRSDKPLLVHDYDSNIVRRDQDKKTKSKYKFNDMSNNGRVESMSDIKGNVIIYRNRSNGENDIPLSKEHLSPKELSNVGRSSGRRPVSSYSKSGSRIIKRPESKGLDNISNPSDRGSDNASTKSSTGPKNIIGYASNGGEKCSSSSKVLQDIPSPDSNAADNSPSSSTKGLDNSPSSLTKGLKNSSSSSTKGLDYMTISMTKGLLNNHSSTRKGLENNHSSTTKGLENNHSSTIKGLENNHSSTIKGLENNHISTTKGLENETISTTKGLENETISTTKGLENETISTTKGLENETISTTKGLENETISTTKGLENETISTTKGLENETISTTKGLLINPNSTTKGLLINLNSTTKGLLINPNSTTKGLLINPISTTKGLLINPNSTTKGLLINPIYTTKGLLIDPNSTTKGLLINPNSTTKDLENNTSFSSKALENKLSSTTKGLEITANSSTKAPDHNTSSSTKGIENKTSSETKTLTNNPMYASRNKANATTSTSQFNHADNHTQQMNTSVMISKSPTNSSQNSSPPPTGNAEINLRPTIQKSSADVEDPKTPRLDKVSKSPTNSLQNSSPPPTGNAEINLRSTPQESTADAEDPKTPRLVKVSKSSTDSLENSSPPPTGNAEKKLRSTTSSTFQESTADAEDPKTPKLVKTPSTDISSSSRKKVHNRNVSMPYAEERRDTNGGSNPHVPRGVRSRPDNVDFSDFSPRNPRFSFPQKLDFVSKNAEDHRKASRLWLSGNKWRGRNMSTIFTNNRMATLETDYHGLRRYLEKGGLNMTRLSREPWPKGAILPWEMDFLNTPPLKDLRDDSSYLKSKVTLLDWKDIYAVGDHVRFRIDVYDGWGRKRNIGGDEVRLWVVERAKLAAVAGKVTDLNNGSYLAEVVLRWPGALKVQVELTFSRAALRINYYYRYVAKCIRFLVAGYVRRLSSEATLCSPFPLIPGYEELCNYTDDGIDWYCGKPRRANLTCSDWVSVRDMEFARPFPFTVAESKLSISLRQPPSLRLIPNSFVLYADRKTKPRKPAIRCSSRNFSETWNIVKPRGYFFGRKWVRTDCRASKLSTARLVRCLTRTTLVLTGDSNLLMLFDLMRQTTGCALLEAPTTHWHRPRSCTCHDIQFHMAWALHGFPAHALSDHWALNGDYQKVTTTLNSIPAKGRFIVIVHLFIHMSMHHHSVFYNRIVAIRKATEELLARNPLATVVIRGPHTSSNGWPPVMGGDMMGTLFRQITVRVFEGLHNRVLFLDFWDMTIAGENPEFHPPDFINRAILGVLFGHVCSTV